MERWGLSFKWLFLERSFCSLSTLSSHPFASLFYNRLKTQGSVIGRVTGRSPMSKQLQFY